MIGTSSAPFVSKNWSSETTGAPVRHADRRWKVSGGPGATHRRQDRKKPWRAPWLDRGVKGRAARAANYVNDPVVKAPKDQKPLDIGLVDFDGSVID